ncbi:hypothetical protein AMJ40_06745 [candidate division TA06 bacterium DG_26]|uniref:Dockerin domain-containing protein n=1 Tax=candidate division TA06 bacterium DG_26 TaxID=1703771 RepID=A0A0S7WFI8_UNCT6|nr:MAG: hypothetical protein AMJ40_06745 [candidate division TA06 bacterium DG_26]
MKWTTRTIALLFIASSLMSTNLFSQATKITRRVMTDDEFNRLKEKEGVFEEGKNYNIVIDGHGTGLRPPTEEQWEEMRRVACVADRIESPGNLVRASHDNSATRWFPPIGTQDGEGSCVTWACGYYTKTFQEAKEHDWDLSGCIWVGGYFGHPSSAYQDKIFSPDFIYHQVNGGGDWGSTYFDVLNLLERVGCCTWEKMPYDPTNSTLWPDEDAWREAPWYRSLTGYGYMWVYDETGLENLKQLLAGGNVAIISIDAGYYSTLSDEDLWTVHDYTATGTNHANAVVGFDDDFGPYTEEGDPSRRGAFKVANSWLVGGWENVPDGFYYISYECMKQRLGYVMFYENRLDYEPEMISVFHLTHDRRGECETTVGIGPPVSPDLAKPFDRYDFNGGDHPFPSNMMVMDITEFMPHMSGLADNFFLSIEDGGSATTGTIDFFSIERYDDYASGVPVETRVSPSPPLNTRNGSSVCAYTAPAIRSVGSMIDDSEGNNDGNPDPDERVALSVTLENLGLTAVDVSAELTTADPYLSIEQSIAGYGDLESGAEMTSLTAYLFSVAGDCPDPHVATLILDIAGAGGAYSTRDSLYVGIGDITGFFDDMEGGTAGWTHRAMTAGYLDQWHQSMQRAHSGTTSWKFGDQGEGNYADGADGGLISPPFLLAANSKFSFWHWMDAETETEQTAWDGAIVMLSVDNADWVQIAPVGGYPYTITPNPASPFDPGTPCLSGSHDWTLVRFDLSDYQGLAQVMFRFGSDSYVTEEGWYVDDLRVEECGDCNGDGRITIDDAVYLKNYCYHTPPGSPAPAGTGDVNQDGRMTIGDAAYLITYLYRGGPPPCQPPGR